MRVLLVTCALGALVACTPTVPNSAAGVGGFDDYDRARTGQDTPRATTTTTATTLPAPGAVSGGETLAGDVPANGVPVADAGGGSAGGLVARLSPPVPPGYRTNRISMPWQVARPSKAMPPVSPPTVRPMCRSNRPICPRARAKPGRRSSPSPWPPTTRWAHSFTTGHACLVRHGSTAIAPNTPRPTWRSRISCAWWAET